MEDKFIVFCHCVRETTGSRLTIPLPPEIDPATLVDYVGKAFNWQFIPMDVEVVPINELNISDEDGSDFLYQGDVDE